MSESERKFKKWWIREFHGPEYMAFLQQEFDAARRYLKTCGKPKTDIDLWLIEEARWSAAYCKHAMGGDL